MHSAAPQVVLFAVPGAFTPTCSLKHLPGFVEKADELKVRCSYGLRARASMRCSTLHILTMMLISQEKGVDTIACVAVNDAFVMDAWGKSVGADGKILLLADGSALFTKVAVAASFCP